MEYQSYFVCHLCWMNSYYHVNSLALWVLVAILVEVIPSGITSTEMESLLTPKGLVLCACDVVGQQTGWVTYIDQLIALTPLHTQPLVLHVFTVPVAVLAVVSAFVTMIHAGIITTKTATDTLRVNQNSDCINSVTALKHTAQWREA